MRLRLELQLLQMIRIDKADCLFDEPFHQSALSDRVLPPAVFTGPAGFLRHRGTSLGNPVLERRAMLDSSSDTSANSPPRMVRELLLTADQPDTSAERET